MRSQRLMLVLFALAAVVLGGWLLFVELPTATEADGRVRTEAARQQTLTDALAAHTLALAVFERDYGEVQDLLSSFAAAGYVSRALVTNADRTVVALVGSVPGTAIGSRLPDAAVTGGRAIPLTLRAEVYGELRVLAPAADAAAAAGARSTTLRAVVVAWLAVSGLLLFLALLGLSRRDAARP